MLFGIVAFPFFWGLWGGQLYGRFRRPTPSPLRVVTSAADFITERNRSEQPIRPPQIKHVPEGIVKFAMLVLMVWRKRVAFEKFKQANDDLR